MLRQQPNSRNKSTTKQRQSKSFPTKSLHKPTKFKTQQLRQHQHHHVLNTFKRTNSTNNNNHSSSQTSTDTNSNPFPHIDFTRQQFPVDATIDKLRKLAPSSRPQSLQDVKDVQRGNFTVPSPFEQDHMIDSSQRIQQHFHNDQRQQIYPASALQQNQGDHQLQQQQQQQLPQPNIGVIGELEGEDEERTFARTIFYGFGANHVVMNGMGFQGSVLATSTMTYLWKPKVWEEVTAESLAILTYIYPQPDVILFGCGPTAKSIDVSAHHYLRTLNIPYELMSTHNAMGTFNLMNEEYRKVAAFVIAFDPKQQYEKQLIQHVLSRDQSDSQSVSPNSPTNAQQNKQKM